MLWKTIGGVTAIDRLGTAKHRVVFLWECSCGKRFVRSGAEVRLAVKRKGRTSCGCLKSIAGKGKNKTHGLSGTRLYDVHRQMMRRCYLKTNADFHNYGGRGIGVCKPWHSVSTFVAWATTSGYKPGLTLDRIDVNSGYSPRNCRWIPNDKQAHNTRKCKKLTFNGQTLVLSEWAKLYGLSVHTLKGRLKRKWPLAQALSLQPKRGRNQFSV